MLDTFLQNFDIPPLGVSNKTNFSGQICRLATYIVSIRIYKPPSQNQRTTAKPVSTQKKSAIESKPETGLSKSDEWAHDTKRGVVLHKRTGQSAGSPSQYAEYHQVFPRVPVHKKQPIKTMTFVSHTRVVRLNFQ